MKRKSFDLYINTSFLLKNKQGIGMYILTLLKVFEKLNLKYKLLDLKINEKLPYKFFYQVIWLNITIFFKTLIHQPRFFISPAFIMPYFKSKKTKYITVIHDLCHLRKDEMSKYNAFVYNISTKNTINRADIIVTVSETIKSDIIEKYNIKSDKIKVVYNAVGEHFINEENNQNILEKYGLEKNNYILSVATLNKRKNIPELTKGFELISDKHPHLKLVLVGGMGSENKKKLATHQNIIITGYIKDEELPTLYKNALLYMYPSLYEGFGIPQIEAQYCGCPLLCSNIPVFHEVSENGAEYCEPNSNDIADKMEYLINNPERREELVELGYENLKRFSTERIAEQLTEVIND